MKRTLIALGVAATVALPVTAQAGFKVYGKLNVALEQYEQDTAGVTAFDNFSLSSYASRFGVKGEDELTANLSAVYGIEWEVSADGSSATDLGQRNRYVGIKHVDFGTLKLGRLDTNLKNAQGKVDLFNDTRADISGYSGVAGQDAGGIIAGETRSNNVIAYESPSFAGGVTVNLQLIPGEASGVGAAPANQYNGIADGISASVVYDNTDLGLYLALARDQEVAGNTVLAASNVGRRDTTRLVGAYKIADLTLGALYQISESVNDPAVAAGTAEEEKAWLLSAAYKISDVTLKAQYVAGENDATTAAERTRYALGADYSFTSKTKAYGYYTAYENDTGAAVAAIESTTLAIGLEHSF